MWSNYDDGVNEKKKEEMNFEGRKKSLVLDEV